MRSKKVEGEHQIDFWPKGPEWSLCPLARPDIAMGPEPQKEAWSARRSRCFKTDDSHCRFASKARKTTTVSTSETTGHRLRKDHLAERRRGLGCLGHRHRGGERYTLDIPLHRRNLWPGRAGIQNEMMTDSSDESSQNFILSGASRRNAKSKDLCPNPKCVNLRGGQAGIPKSQLCHGRAGGNSSFLIPKSPLGGWAAFRIPNS